MTEFEQGIGKKIAGQVENDVSKHDVYFQEAIDAFLNEMRVQAGLPPIVKQQPEVLVTFDSFETVDEED
jgi:hypothetical protein